MTAHASTLRPAPQQPPTRGPLPHARIRAHQLRQAGKPARSVFRPLGEHLPTLGDVEASLAMLGRGPATQLRYDAPGLSTVEGRTWYLTGAPGAVGLVCVDENRRERSIERGSTLQQVTADALATYAGPDGVLNVDFLEERVRGAITSWSRKSRARMTRRLAQLDVAAWDLDHLGYPAALGYGHQNPLGMVTVTYPGDWTPLVPDGEIAKKHLRAFRDAIRREFGPYAAWALWKQEFQRRGAPHFHLLMRCPARTSSGEVFELWLSRTWAGIVRREFESRRGTDGERLGNRMDPAEHARHLAAGTGVDFTARMTDARRIAVYFSKHGDARGVDKEYQHIVPTAWLARGGAGRFWGVWGVPYADRAVELDQGDAIAVRRVLRRVLKARTGRKVWTLGSSGQMCGGTVVVNDGPALVHGIARYLVIRRRPVYDGRDLLPERPLLP